MAVTKFDFFIKEIVDFPQKPETKGLCNENTIQLHCITGVSTNCGCKCSDIETDEIDYSQSL